MKDENRTENETSKEEKTSKSDGGLKKVVQDMGVIGISRILTTISGIILIPVLTKNLGADGYGLWSLVLVTTGLSLIVLQLGFPVAIVRLFPGKDFENIRGDLYAILAIVILITGFFSIFLFSFPKILADAIFEGNVILVQLLAVIIFVQCLDTIFLAIFQAFREMKKRAVISILTKYSELGLAISLVLLGYGIIGAILAIFIVRCGQLIILSIIIQNKIPFKKPNFSSVKEYISFGLPIVPKSIFDLVINLSDRYVIGFFLGATFVGYYTPGYGLGLTIPKFLASTLSIVLLPSLSEFFEKNNMAEVKKILELSTKFFLLITIPAFIGLILVGRPILLWFTTPEIAQNGYIILVLSSIAGIFIGLYSIFVKTFYLEKRTKLITVLIGIGAGINLFGNIIFVPRFGIFAAGITTIISYIVIVIFTLNFSFKKFPIRPDYTSIVKIILSSLLMGISMFYFKQHIYENPILLIAIGVTTYFSFLYGIGGLKKKEISYLKNLYK